MESVTMDMDPTNVMAMTDPGYLFITNATDIPPDLDPEPSMPKSLAKTLWIFVGPIIFVIGICGNILILLVMGKKRMRGTTTSIYLRLMAFADICVLITGMIPEWLEAADIVTFKEIHPATCKLEKFTFYTSADTAIWILVIFTVDRFIAVCFPLEKKDYCLPSRSKFFALGALLSAVVKNFHVFWTRGAEYRINDNNETYLASNCGRPSAGIRYFEKDIRPWLVFALVDAIPFCIILVCNVFIIRALIIVKKLRSEQAIVSNSDRQLVQMTLMCLSASFCFVICITPSIVLLIGKEKWSKPPNRSYDIAKAVNNQLVYVNHSINFFLYCMTGRRFRTVLVRMFSCSSGGSPSASMDSNTKTTVYRTTLPTAKINSSKNGNLLAIPNKNKNTGSPRLGGNRVPNDRTPEASPFLRKKNMKQIEEESSV